MMFIPLTGTPGTGKTTVAKVLEGRGYRIMSVEELAKRHGCLEAENEIDVWKLRKAAQQPEEEIILDGHLAHYVPGRMNIVLRCNPNIVRQRLEARGYGPEKVQENVEAEAIDLILSESLDMCLFVFEIDTTEMEPEQAADAIEKIMKGEVDEYAPGRVDWSKVVMDWY